MPSGMQPGGIRFFVGDKFLFGSMNVGNVATH